MTIQHIIEVFRSRHGQDLSVFSDSFLKKILMLRMTETASEGMKEYLDIVDTNSTELSNLNDLLHNTYSLFFRNLVDSSLLEGFILPEILREKMKNKSQSIRIWSVGCAEGPEPYTLAMIADKVISDKDYQLPVMVFGTDISADILKKARIGTYDVNMVQNVKLAYLNRYFTIRNSLYSVHDDIRSFVDFYPGDIIDPAFTSPPAGIFADFDLVTCCNLMIYYNQGIRQKILEKLYHAVGRNRYLQVGESEQKIVEKFGRFRLLSPYGNIFIKN